MLSAVSLELKNSLILLNTKNLLKPDVVNQTCFHCLFFFAQKFSFVLVCLVFIPIDRKIPKPALFIEPKISYKGV